MSLLSMKMKQPGETTAAGVLAHVPCSVTAIHDAPEAREISVHMRPVNRPELGAVDLVLREDDRDQALLAVEAGTLVVGATFNLTIALG